MKRYDSVDRHGYNCLCCEMTEAEDGDYVRYADLPEVHDLRVNPADLPDNNLRDVLVFSKTRQGCKCHTGYYQPHYGEWKRVENGDSVTIPNVIGWQELPTWEGLT